VSTANPLGIDVSRPRLIWQVQSDERNQRQTAYQILVADSKELLKNDQGDLWDSGKIVNDETVNIVFVGKALTSGEECFWKIKVWDKNGKASDWSAPASWSMGLVEQSDWQGKWIGWDQGEKTNDFKGATWIWFPEGNPAVSAKVSTCYFRRVLGF
jgi:alpha-L-rhamnosidase